MTGTRGTLAVLARYQAGATLLAGGIETAFMHSPVYLLLPFVWAAGLLWCARAVRLTSRRLPLRLLTAAQVLLLASAALSALLGRLVPAFDWTPSIMNLVTFLVLPAAMLALIRRARGETLPPSADVGRLAAVLASSGRSRRTAVR